MVGEVEFLAAGVVVVLEVFPAAGVVEAVPAFWVVVLEVFPAAGALEVVLVELPDAAGLVVELDPPLL